MKYLKLAIDRFTNWLSRHLLAVLFTSFVFFGGFIVLFPRVVVQIPVGHVGVLFRPFLQGVDLKAVYSEGVHIILPFNRMAIYSIALHVHKMDMEVLTSDLLKTKVSVSFQYVVNEPTVPLMHRYIGEDYLNTYILPELTASVREAFGKMSSQDAFTGDLRPVSKNISLNTDNYLINNLSPAGLNAVRLVNISSFQIEAVVFPPDVQASIENKIVLSNDAEAMKYKIQSSQQEAKRKVIEGEGIQKYQNLINPGMNDFFLKHEGINASLKLAESNNSKIIMFGTTTGGLPLILGDVDSTLGANIKNQTEMGASVKKQTEAEQSTKSQTK
jgi:regulator of protease activity HflC (stomatin/prohibitin superfamily)